MNLLEVDDKSWEQKVELAEQPVLVMFYSTTCPGCKALEPYFTEYAEEYAGKVQFARLNVYENQFTAERYGITGTPTFKFFCNGKPVQELLGAATTLLVPFYVDEVEVENIASFIARINPDIPYSLLVFHPEFYMRDMPITSRGQVYRCYEVAKRYLKNVNIGNKQLLL